MSRVSIFRARFWGVFLARLPFRATPDTEITTAFIHGLLRRGRKPSLSAAYPEPLYIQVFRRTSLRGGRASS